MGAMWRAVFEEMMQKLKSALDQGGWKGRYGKAEVLHIPPEFHCLIALHPMTSQERAWAKSAGVHNVHDWKAIRLRMRYSDGCCVLELPHGETHEFSYGAVDDVLRDVLVLCEERISQEGADMFCMERISQEAVDMFVESIVKNDAGQSDVQSLMRELCAKIQNSEAWV